MKRLVICGALTLLVPVGAAAAQRITDEVELRGVFSDRELSDSTHYAYQFKRDGHLGGEEMGREVQGQWRIENHRLCLSWRVPAGAQECYEVYMAGREVQLLRHGREMYFGILVRLKPLH